MTMYTVMKWNNKKKKFDNLEDIDIDSICIETETLFIN